MHQWTCLILHTYTAAQNSFLCVHINCSNFNRSKWFEFINRVAFSFQIKGNETAMKNKTHQHVKLLYNIQLVSPLSRQCYRHDQYFHSKDFIFKMLQNTTQKRMKSYIRQRFYIIQNRLFNQQNKVWSCLCRLCFRVTVLSVEKVQT